LPDTDLFRQADRTISPRCENFAFAVERLGERAAYDYYFFAGHQVAQAILDFLDWRGEDPGSLSMLDFASGYGRVTRYLVHRFRTVWVSDLEDDMLDFCSSHFGAPGFLSVGDPSKPWSADRRFELVFCHSLFTALCESQWVPWLQRLAALVEPGGHLLITTQGAKFAAKLRGEDPSGVSANDGPEFDFIRGNETKGRLDPRCYGTAFASDRFVRNAARTVGELEVVRHFEMGDFDLFHDVYAFARPVGSRSA
jgi:SAM-dependent methyltransferase